LLLRTVIVDLDSISGIESIQVSDDSLLEALANSIIQLKGLLHLPTLKLVGIDEYEILSGHMDVRAYWQAHQLDPSLPDRIMVFVADRNNETAIRQQLAVYGQPDRLDPAAGAMANLEVGNLAARLDRAIAHQNQLLLGLQADYLAQLDAAQPQCLTVAVALAHIKQPAINSKIAKILGKSKTTTFVNQLVEANSRDHLITIVRQFITTTRSGKTSRLVGDQKLLEIIDVFMSEAAQPAPQSKTIQTSLPTTTASVDSPPHSLASRLDECFAAQSQLIIALTQELTTKLEAVLPTPLPLFVAFDRILEPLIAQQVAKNLAFLGDAKVQKLISLLESAKQQGHSLTSLAAVRLALTTVKAEKTTRLIGDKKMIEVIDRWYR
jgi:hypothetical protein